MLLKAVIVEDEIDCQISLNNLLSQFCQTVKVVATADRISQAVRDIQEYEPDLVFLDIQLPKENGFALFDYFSKPNFQVIFTSGHNHFAIKAFKFSAIDYLLKPIDPKELKNAITAAQARQSFHVTCQKIEILKENLNKLYEKMILPTQDGFSFIEIKDIIYCEARGNYTMFFLLRNEKIMVSKTLKLYGSILGNFSFFRISRTHLINLNHIKKYGRQKCPTITMQNGTTISISIKRRKAFLEKMTHFVTK